MEANNKMGVGGTQWQMKEKVFLINFFMTLNFKKKFKISPKR